MNEYHRGHTHVIRTIEAADDASFMNMIKVGSCNLNEGTPVYHTASKLLLACTYTIASSTRLDKLSPC